MSKSKSSSESKINSLHPSIFTDLIRVFKIVVADRGPRISGVQSSMPGAKPPSYKILSLILLKFPTTFFTHLHNDFY